MRDNERMCFIYIAACVYIHIYVYMYCYTRPRCGLIRITIT